MTEQKTTDPFETRVADLVRAYTDPAGTRPVDALAVSRNAMASRRTAARGPSRLGTGSLGRSVDGGRWAAAALAVVLIGTVGFAVVSRSSNSGIGPQPSSSASAAPSPRASAIGPVPETLRHSWERPLPITPGPSWATAYLDLTSDVLGIRPAPEAARSVSAIAAAGPDLLVVDGTAETAGCAVGDAGTYRWLLEGKDTFMTLTAVGQDGCATREAALVGPWVRTDLPAPDPEDGPMLTPGTHETSRFDPFGNGATAGELSYTVPDGWKVKDDSPGTFALHRPAGAEPSQPATGTFIAVYTRARIAEDFLVGEPCGPERSEVPGVEHGMDAIVKAIQARPGVVSTPPLPVTIGGYDGRMLDISISPSWTGGCVAPDGSATTIGIPLLVEAGTELGPVIGIGPGLPVRLILVDLGDERTMSIAIFGVDPLPPASFAKQVEAAMPVIESFELHPPTP